MHEKSTVFVDLSGGDGAFVLLFFQERRKKVSKIDLSGMISIPYLKKAVFTGSHCGMRFLLRKKTADDVNTIETAVWPGPYIFSVTEEEKKTFSELEFSAEGLSQAIDWLNQQYEEKFSES